MREAEIGEVWPELPDWADPTELDPEVRRDLRGLSKEGAEFVGAHLLAAGTLAEEDPELAWRHARAARSKGGRIAVVRETAGLVAYRAGEWSEAIAELRAARRMGGGSGHLPVMADCERALGHPEKAIELSRSAEAAELDPAQTAELRIVVAGARADLDQLDAALAHLEGSGLRTDPVQPFSARLYYAYADLLAQAGRGAEAMDWFIKAADVDEDEETDAGDRIAELADSASEETLSADAPAVESAERGHDSADVEAVDLESADGSKAIAEQLVAEELVAEELVAEQVVAVEVGAEEVLAEDLAEELGAEEMGAEELGAEELTTGREVEALGREPGDAVAAASSAPEAKETDSDPTAPAPDAAHAPTAPDDAAADDAAADDAAADDAAADDSAADDSAADDAAADDSAAPAPRNVPAAPGAPGTHGPLFSHEWDQG